MAGGLLPLDIEIPERKPGVMALAGAVAYLELIIACGLVASIRRHLNTLEQKRGWHLWEHVVSLIFLNVAGGWGSIQNSDLAGGRFPSGDFGENAAWWHIVVLAQTLTLLLRQYVLSPEFPWCRMKALRVWWCVMLVAGCFVLRRTFALPASSGTPACGLPVLPPCVSE